MLENAKPSLLESILRAVLKILWEPFSRKQSYFWNWKPYQGKVDFLEIVRKNHKAKNRNTFWRNFWQSNFGWKTIEVLTPVSRIHDLPSGGFYYDVYVEDYYLGFYNQDKSQYEVCWLKLNRHIAVLAGDKDIQFFAINSKTLEPAELISFGRINKREFRKYKIKNNLEKTPLI